MLLLIAATLALLSSLATLEPSPAYASPTGAQAYPFMGHDKQLLYATIAQADDPSGSDALRTSLANADAYALSSGSAILAAPDPALSPMTDLAATATVSPVLTLTKQTSNHWSLRSKLTFTNTVTETLTSFPLLVMIDSSRIDYSQTQSAGQDIRFVDADRITVLAHEIERWNSGGTSYVWVKVPQIDGLSNTDHIWMYYGNPSTPDGQDPAHVWSEGYRMVYHLQEDPTSTGGILRDSTASGFHGTNQGSTDASGIIANAQRFNGSNQYIDLGADLAVINGVSAATVSAWIRADTTSGDGHIVSVSRYNATVQSRAAIIQNNQRLQTFARSLDDDSDWHSNSTATTPIAAGVWHYVAAVIDYASDTITFYADGVWQPTSGSVSFSASTTPNTNSSYSAIGSNEIGADGFFDGGIDEARVASAARSADWISAQYRSMTDNFISFGSIENTDRVSGSPIVGAPFTYTLTITNSGLATATNVIVTDVVPSGANYISGGTFVSGNTVSWTIPTIPISSSVQVTFVVGTCRASVLNTACRAVTSTQNVSSTLGRSLLTLLYPPTLQAGFSYDPLTATVGSEITFTGAVTTNGSSIMGWTWDFGNGGKAMGPTVNYTYTTDGIYPIKLLITDTCGYTGTATMPIIVDDDSLADLATGKAVDNPGPNEGDIIVYTIAVTNSGPGDATTVVLTDALPIGVTHISDDPSQGSYDSATGRWDVGTLLNGNVATLLLTATVNAGTAGTTITNTITGLRADQLDPISANNLVSAAITVRHNPVLGLTKTGPATARAGQTAIFVFSVTNDDVSGDGSPIHNITVNDDYAGTATYLSGDDGNSLLETGETWVFIAAYVFRFDDPTPLVNTGTATGEDNDGDPVSVTATHGTTLTYAPMFSLVKLGPNTARVGQTVVYTFVVANVPFVPTSLSPMANGSSSSLTSIVVTDSIAGPAAYVAGDVNGNNELDTGEAWVYRASYTIQSGDPDPLVNTGRATGWDGNGKLFTSVSTHSTDVEPPYLYLPIVFKNH